MIEFKKNYTEKFINITPDNNFNYELVNQYGPWVATVSNKSDMDLFIASPKMAEYMMERSKKLSEEISYGDLVADHFELIGHMEPEKREELKTILSILKDAGIDEVEK